MINFYKLGISTGGRTSGRMKTRCPKCHDARKNKSDKSLSVNLDNGLYKCHYCQWSGCAEEKTPDWRTDRPAQASQQTQQTRPATVPPAQPSLFSLVDDRQQPLLPAHVDYLASRGISLATAQRMQLASEEGTAATGRKESYICFNFLENGEKVNVKYRTIDKRFRLVKDAELIPYNIDAIEDTAECIITEGEIDALSFIEAGCTPVVSVPNGAGGNLTWMDRFMKTHFEDKQTVYVAVDTDRKGRQLRAELVRRLGIERCRVVSFGPDCKDANELLVKEGPAALLNALNEAPLHPLDGVYTAEDVAGAMRVVFENGLAGGAGVGFRTFDRFCTFEPMRLVVLTGLPGCGKSEFVDELVLRLSIRHGWKAAYFSPENMPLPYHLRKLAEKLTGRTFALHKTSEMLYEASMQWLAKNVYSIDPKHDYRLPAILDKARALVARQGIRVLVIDPVNRIEHDIPRGMTETQYVSTMLDTLTNFAMRNGVLLILVAHPRKINRLPGSLKEPRPTMTDINGSMNYYNKCDYGIVVERDYESGITHVHIDKVRFRNLGGKGMASFVFNHCNGRFHECEFDPHAANPDSRAKNTVFDNACWLGEEYKEHPVYL